MANIMDYLDWRGDLTFENAAFNEVDNLILAQLVYVEFAGIVPGEGSSEEIPLGLVCEQFWQQHTEEEVLSRVSMTKTAPLLMRKMAKTARFGEAKLSRYVNEISREEQSQFSVVCIRLSDDSLYVAFSGTDDTIVGWHENFNMGWLDATPGQKKAVAYLNRILESEQVKVRVGGHSKGGNLAVYSAVKCEKRFKDKILHVYSNDGPGFSVEMTKSDGYTEMIGRISTILPESSIVGMILEHQEKFEIVGSSASGARQHDAMSWKVLGPAFCRVEKISSESLMLDETMKNWMGQMEKKEWEQFVETVFDVLDDAGIRTVDDFYRSPWKKLQELFRAKSRLSEEQRKSFSKWVRLLWNSGNDVLKKTVKSL